MDQNGIGAGAMIGLGPPESFAETPSGNKSLDARDNAKIIIQLGILAGLNLAAKFVDVGQRLCVARNETVRFRKNLVFYTNRRNPSLLKFMDQSAEIIEAPIPIELQFGELGRFRRFGGSGGTVDTTGFGALQDSLAAVRDSLDQAGQWGFVQETSTSLVWQQFQNFGTYSFHVHAIDTNYADYLASSNQDAQFLDEPRFHVTGGIGILASLAPSSVTFVIRE